jgi:protein disulfide-isomerase
MRLLPVSLLAFFASAVIAQAPEQPLGAVNTQGEISEENADEAPKPTIFNGVEVPPIPDIDGEKYNATIKDGYWFVKHHS